MTGNAGQHINPCAGMDAEIKLTRHDFNTFIHGQRKRCAAQFNRVNPQHQMMHHRIAHQHDINNIIGFNPGLTGRALKEGLQTGPHGIGHLNRAAFIEEAVGNPAHEVFPETDLRVHGTGRSQHHARIHITEMRRHGGGADINRGTDHLFLQPRPDPDDTMPVTQGNGDLPFAFAEDGLQPLQHCHISGHRLTGEAIRPLVLQRLDHSPQITGRVMHIGFAHLNETQPGRCIHFDHAGISVFADDLIMDLAFRRNINHHIGTEDGLAGKPAPGGKASFIGIAILNTGPRRHAIG